MTGRQTEVTGAGAGPRGSADEATGCIGPKFRVAGLAADQIYLTT